MDEKIGLLNRLINLIKKQSDISINKKEMSLTEDNEDNEILSIENNSTENLKIEREINNMSDSRVNDQNVCNITNTLDQVILKVNKRVITPEQLANIGATINLGHIDDYQVLDVAFKHKQEINNPCGNGTIEGEVLLKAIVVVGSVHYSWLLYDKITNAIVYDGEADFITAYSVYDIVKFEDEERPQSVTTKFTTTVFEQLVDDPTLDYYLFKVQGTVDLVSE